MFKFIAVVLAALIAYVAAAAKPGLVAPLAYTAAAPAAAVYSHEYHGNYAAPYVAAAPYLASPYVASPYVAAAAPYTAAAYAAPLLLKK